MIREKQRKHETTPKQSTNLKDLRTKMETTLGFTTTKTIRYNNGAFDTKNSSNTMLTR